MIRPFVVLTAALGFAVMASSMSGTETAAPKSVPVTAEVGVRVEPAHITEIPRPGLYGLGTSGEGQRYAVVGSSLVRLDAANVILAVIRPIVRPVLAER